MDIHPRFGPAFQVQRVLSNFSLEEVATQTEILGNPISAEGIDDIEQCRRQATTVEFETLCQTIELSQQQMLEACDSLQETEWATSHLSEHEQARIALDKVDELIQQTQRRRRMEDPPPN